MFKNHGILLYIERWLKTPVQHKDGNTERTEKGTPQGGVISPLLSNLFMHYTIDVWMQKHHPKVPWARYADDGIMHCTTKEEAKALLKMLGQKT